MGVFIEQKQVNGRFPMRKVLKVKPNYVKNVPLAEDWSLCVLRYGVRVYFIKINIQLFLERINVYFTALSPLKVWWSLYCIHFILFPASFPSSHNFFISSVTVL